MFIALNQDKDYISAQQAKKHQTYYCPACQQAVLLKKGPMKQAHFAHRQQTACSSFSEAESPDHLQAKCILFHWLNREFENVKLEVYLNDLKQRPDLLFTDDKGQAVCVEVQCSSLATSTMLERSRSYLTHGYKVWWIIAKDLSLKAGKLSALQKLFLYSFRETIFLFQLNIKATSLEIISNIKRKNLNTYHWTKTSFQLQHSSYQNILNYCHTFPSSKGIEKINFYDYHRQAMLAFRLSQPKYQPLAEKFYRAGLSLQTCPHLIYQPVSYDWLIRTPPMEWKFDILSWLNQLGQGSLFSQRHYLNFCRSLHLNYEQTPFVCYQLKIQPFLLFLDVLEGEKIIKMIGPSRYRFVNCPAKYKNEQEKIKQLQTLC